MLRSAAFVTPNPWKLLWIKYNMAAMMNSVYELEEENAYKNIVEPTKQVDYLHLHNEYLATKAKMMDQYLNKSKL